MEQHGIDNVRGGSYTQMQLPEEQRTHLSRVIKSANDKCFRCGATDHFVGQCYAASHGAARAADPPRPAAAAAITAAVSAPMLGGVYQSAHHPHPLRCVNTAGRYRPWTCDVCQRAGTIAGDRLRCDRCDWDCQPAYHRAGASLHPATQAEASWSRRRSRSRSRERDREYGAPARRRANSPPQSARLHPAAPHAVLGVARVRGGPAMQPFCCARCGHASHAADQCYASTDRHGERIGRSRAAAAAQYGGGARSQGGTVVCFRCGRPGHTSPQCYAQTHI